ncbi:MAG: hypothetical protein LRY54_03010 [Alphaproteobacteria bacterium]|nr:hypothetical protein [Alphaproteobacteria bacterium]
MKLLTFVLAILLLSATSSYAECSHSDSIYTDGGRYELYVDNKKQPFSSTFYYLKLVDTETDNEYLGQVVYNNGFSIPHVQFSITCNTEQKAQQKKRGEHKEFCGHYDGTIYTIDGEKTHYGFSHDKPMLIPNLAHDLNYAWGSAYLFPMPNDIWKFKGCKK